MWRLQLWQLLQSRMLVCPLFPPLHPHMRRMPFLKFCQTYSRMMKQSPLSVSGCRDQPIEQRAARQFRMQELRSILQRRKGIVGLGRQDDEPAPFGCVHWGTDQVKIQFRRLKRLLGRAKRRAIRFSEHVTGDGLSQRAVEGVAQEPGERCGAPGAR
jgi:hypothetical protein